jgi:hypothetical protein
MAYIEVGRPQLDPGTRCGREPQATFVSVLGVDEVDVDPPSLVAGAGDGLSASGEGFPEPFPVP